MHSCVALLRTMPGVTEETVQVVTSYLGLIIEHAESQP
jgi:spore maturation protein SpmB